MKTKHILSIFVLGILLQNFGKLCKVQHWPGGFMLIMAASLLLVIFWILILWKAFTHPMLREFMEK